MKPLQPVGKPRLAQADKMPRGNGARPIGNSLNTFIQAALLVVLAGFATPSPGASLGRLFFTPDERANLDRAREVSGIAAPESAPTEQAGSVTLNGIVKRSNGKTTIWVNQTVQHETDIPPSSKKLAGKSQVADFPVLVQKTGKTVTLKVGQTLEIDSGVIREGYRPAPRKEPPPALASPSATTAATSPEPASSGAAPLNQS
jgi:hypothetical protein